MTLFIYQDCRLLISMFFQLLIKQKNFKLKNINASSFKQVEEILIFEKLYNWVGSLGCLLTHLLSIRQQFGYS